jgi:NRPS condensation-like uncharacterized protein
MQYKAEIFDKVQYLYEETKFNDHQLHCVIRFDGQTDEGVLRRAVMMLLQAIPILSCVYRHDGGNDYWENADPSGFADAFLIVHDQTAFEDFTISKVNESTGPQIKVCLYRSENDSLSAIMNHMVCDAAGFKSCLYLLSDFYSHLIDEPGYLPDFKIDGDRGFQNIIRKFPFWSRIKSLLFHNSESNQNGKIIFPLSEDKKIFPFILTREIGPEKFRKICAYCKSNNVTINDVFLAAYYRALLQKIRADGHLLHIPIMVDMRRYSEDDGFDALSNLSSTMITHVPVSLSESFEETVFRINAMMKIKKSTDIGLNGFMKLALIFKILNKKSSYKITKSALKNPPICMTNIGVLDDKKLFFKKASIKSAFLCGSIKYRPHFQIALSSFAGTITLSSNLYGSLQDYNAITCFLAMVEDELPIRKKEK